MKLGVWSMLPALGAALLLFRCTGDDSSAVVPDGGSPAEGGGPADAAVPPDGSEDASVPDGSGDADAALGSQSLRFVFVHGFQSSDDVRVTAQDDLIDVETYVLSTIEARAVAYEAGRSVGLVVESRRVNLYTDLEGALLAPCLDCESDGTGIATATRWREQLVAKIEQAYPNGEGNLVLVGHSTGARVAMEVAANVGGIEGPQSHDWGLSERIAGVVTAHGAIDALDSAAYALTGPISFHFGCTALNEDGICDYLGFVSAVAAADAVAAEGRALMLTSWADCGLSAFAGASDKTLPAAAMGSPRAWGMTMVPAGGTLTMVPAHGHFYGAFCHSDLTNADSPRHVDAVASLGEHILDWLFLAAPRVVNLESPDSFIEAPALAPNTLSESFPVVAECGSVDQDFGAPEVVGSCRHPEILDGDDHALDPANLVVTDAAECGGSFAWQHPHTGEQHAAQLWYKSYAVPEGGGLLYRLPIE
jgi:pimeloyl-ACP methyl ester carboxylesterase